MIRPLVRIAAAVISGAIVQATTPAIGAWERFHGDAANRGFADVDTRPAAGGSLSVPGLGTFTLGSGPVIAPDGRLTRASRSSPRPPSAWMVRSM
jgi:hypothetical protein